MKKLLFVLVGISMLGVATLSGCRAEVDPDGKVSTQAPMPR